MTIKQLGGIFGRNPTFNDVTVDGGIYFEDGQSGNYLDDYEEGTWTPAITFGGASAGIVYTQQEGSYTKIGRQVFVNFVIRLSSKGTSTGSMVITGLPFVKSSSTDFGHIFCGTIANAASLNSMPFGGINAGATTIAVRHLNDPNGSGGSDPQLTNANVNNFLVIGMSGVYETS